MRSSAPERLARNVRCTAGMNIRKIFLAIILADFMALTGYVIYQFGPIGWLEYTIANPVTVLLSVDLVLALGISVFWMVRDASKRGINATPYVLLTLFTGSAGPLLYLVRRPSKG